jgi:hypothetical protein
LNARAALMLAGLFALAGCDFDGEYAARCGHDECVIGPDGGPMPVLDAGPDAGPPPMNDAGPAVDAGEPDAGEPDAGRLVDAGALDAGGSTDAGPPDAGLPMDAGSGADAGSEVDAGAPDPCPTPSMSITMVATEDASLCIPFTVNLTCAGTQTPLLTPVNFLVSASGPYQFGEIFPDALCAAPAISPSLALPRASSFQLYFRATKLGQPSTFGAGPFTITVQGLPFPQAVANLETKARAELFNIPASNRIPIPTDGACTPLPPNVVLRSNGATVVPLIDLNFSLDVVSGAFTSCNGTTFNFPGNTTNATPSLGVSFNGSMADQLGSIAYGDTSRPWIGPLQVLLRSCLHGGVMTNNFAQCCGAYNGTSPLYQCQ